MRRIILFFGIAGGLLLTHFGLILINTCYFDPPRFSYASLWIKNFYIIKDHINSKPTNKQRLLIVSGSNSRFSFNGNIIDSQTHFAPINYGTHAGLPINFHIDKIITQAHEGDIIFLPLEFSYYTNKEPFEDYAYIQSMLTWGNGYNKYMNKENILQAYLENKPWDMLKLLFKPQKIENDPNPIATMEAIWAKGEQKYTGATSYKSLNRYGDMCGHIGNKYFGNERYLKSNLTLSPFFLSEYNRLLEFAASKHIKIFLIYPVTLENPSFSLNDPQTFAKIENLKAELKKHNIEIYGDFRDFHFERKYFFDTAYHLNEEGAILRTQAFIKLLKHMQQEGLIP